MALSTFVVKTKKPTRLCVQRFLMSVFYDFCLEKMFSYYII